VLIAVRAEPDGQPMADVASGGLLPTRVEGMPGHFDDLVAGETGSVAVQAPSPGEAFRLLGHPNLDLPWLALVGLVCSLPLLWCLLVGLSPEDEQP